jgi:hypothetical protein
MRKMKQHKRNRARPVGNLGIACALSLEEYAEHLILHHSEIAAVCCAREIGVAMLTVLDLVAALTVVGKGEGGVGLAVGIAIISNAQISSQPEYRPAFGVAIDQVFSLLWHVLLAFFEGEQEGL